MKKFLILAVLSFCSMMAMAQTKAFVKVTSDDVNIRKSPDTSAPKLMKEYTESCFNCPAEFFWGAKAKRRNYIQEVAHPEVGILYDFSEEKNGWYKIQYYSYGSGDIPGWVSAKFAKKIYLGSAELI